MSKARLVITAVAVEGRSQSEVAREYGVSQGWISRLVARYRMEGRGRLHPTLTSAAHRPSTVTTDHDRAGIELREKLASKGLDHGPLKRTGSGGGSGYWISTRGWSVRFVA